jgi:hypothetical protein
MKSRTAFPHSTLLVLATLIPSLSAFAQSVSDYEKDTTRTFVNERAGDALEQVNSILCMFDQTKYSDPSLLNAGPYVALVDESACSGRDDTNKSSSSSSGGTSANDAKEYTTFKVNSTRSSATAPQIVTAFLHVNGPAKQDLNVQVKMSITEGASEFNPLGAFSLSFKGSLPGSPGTLMRGVVSSSRDALGRVVVKFSEAIGGGSSGFPEMESTKAALIKNTVGGTGSVFSRQMSGGQGDGGPGGQSELRSDFAYDQEYFLRKDVGANQQQCLSRSTFETSAWSYGLYNAQTGARITRNSGFPINTQADGRGAFGFLGFSGLFVPPGAPTLSDGDRVYRMERGQQGPSATPYSVYIRNGKLKKYTRSETTLGQLKNVPLEGPLPTPGSPNQMGVMARVTWDGATLAVRATANGSSGGPPNWTDVVPPQVFNRSNPVMFSDLGLFSQALGGQVRIKLSNCTPVNPFNPGQGLNCDTPTDSTKVLFFKESVVQPTDPTVPASLTCYENCPKAGTTGMDKNDLTYASDGTAHTYTYVDGLLRDNGNPVVLSEASQGQSWGFGSMPLFNGTADNLAKLACPFNPNQICGWRAWGELAEFYTWETGPNIWNKFTSAKDSNGTVVQFDPPLNVQLVYPAAGTAGLNPAAVDQKYAGNAFVLQYGGFGQLQGIPGKCFNPENPADNDPDCSKPNRRWVPEFTIPAGLAVTDQATGVSYLVKPLEVEQRMAKADLAACSGIQVSDLSALWPDLTKDWSDPNLGEEPTIVDPPKVIGGVLQ